MRPLTFILHLAIALPLYIVTIIPVWFMMTFKLLRHFLGLSPPPSAPTDRSPDVPRIFFDGAGYAFWFSLGVAQHLREEYDLQDKAEIFAISAGNLAAIALLLDLDASSLLLAHYPALRQHTLASHFREPLCGFCNRLGVVSELLHDLLPDNVHTLASGRYHVMLNSWPLLRMKYVSHFDSKQEFIDAVVASMSLPGFVCLPMLSLHADWPGLWLDGGLDHCITPVEPIMDLSVRTFPDPLRRFGKVDMLPPLDWNMHAKGAFPHALSGVLRGLQESKLFAAAHPALARLQPWRKRAREMSEIV